MFIILSFAEVFNINYIIIKALKIGIELEKHILESLDQLAKKAIELQPLEKIKLVEAILSSLDKPDPEIEKSWVAESEARYEAYKRREIEVKDWEEIKKELVK